MSISDENKDFFDEYIVVRTFETSIIKEVNIELNPKHQAGWMALLNI